MDKTPAAEDSLQSTPSPVLGNESVPEENASLIKEDNESEKSEVLPPAQSKVSSKKVALMNGVPPRKVSKHGRTSFLMLSLIHI